MSVQSQKCPHPALLNHPSFTVDQNGNLHPTNADRDIYLNGNSPSPCLVQHNSGLLDILKSDPKNLLWYQNANDLSDPRTLTFHESIADRESTDLNGYRIYPGAFGFIRNLPLMINAKSGLVIQNDFFLYKHALKLARSRVSEVPASTMTKAINHRTVIDLIRKSDADIFMATTIGNPGQWRMNISDFEAIAKACPDTIILINDAYGQYLSSDREVEYGASLPIRYNNVIFIRPMSKDQVACSARLAYIRVNDDLDTRLLKDWREPYVSAHDMEVGTQLLNNKEVVKRSVDIQTNARLIAEKELAKTGFQSLSGPGPWVQVYVGHHHTAYVESLQQRYSVRVQDQANLDKRRSGYIRISTTIPEEIRYCIASMIQIHKDIENLKN